MPIKWTPENDQALLLKILETSDVQADVKAISEAWPADRCDAQGKPPTPRAITERLVKIRSLNKASGNGAHFKVKSGKVTKKDPSSNNPSTPRKPRTPKAATTPKQEIKPEPLAISPVSSQASVDDVSEVATPATVGASGGVKRGFEDGVRIKGEFDGGGVAYAPSFEDLSVETPSKKAKYGAFEVNYPVGSEFQSVYYEEDSNAC